MLTRGKQCVMLHSAVKNGYPTFLQEPQDGRQLSCRTQEAEDAVWAHDERASGLGSSVQGKGSGTALSKVTFSTLYAACAGVEEARCLDERGGLIQA